jgi:hypothetical protein
VKWRISKRSKQKPWLQLTILTSIAGLVYCSWPLGYWLNPLVSQRGLASELEGLHQPYNWVFISLDVVSGLLVAVAAWYMWHWRKKIHHPWLLAILANFALFGIFTAIDAVLPLRCDPTISKCSGGLLNNPLLIAHGVFSIAASVCLFISVALVWWLGRRYGGSKIMAMLIVGWTVFGLLSLLFFFVPGPGYLAQHYYITLCSAWTAILPYTVWQLLIRHKKVAAPEFVW